MNLNPCLLRASTTYYNIFHINGFNKKGLKDMGYQSNKLPIIVIALFLSSMSPILSQTFIPIQITAQEEDNQEPDIPKAMCIYKEQEYSLTPHIFNDGEKSSTIAFPELPDNYEPQMTVQQGEELTMEFDGDKQPNNIQALLVDYDADVTETYPIKKIDDNKFEVTQPGIKTLEVIASFPDGEHISYTMLVDVKENGENNY
jgi:hypothetical protein